MGRESTPVGHVNEVIKPSAAAAENLVIDVRAGVGPALMVERKLAVLLRGVPLPATWLLSARPHRAPS